MLMLHVRAVKMEAPHLDLSPRAWIVVQSVNVCLDRLVLLLVLLLEEEQPPVLPVFYLELNQ